MIEETDDGYEVHCDHCSYADTFDADSWSAMIAAIKLNGWRIAKIGGEWIHTCPGCAEEANN